MGTRTSGMRRRALALAVAALGIVAISGTALAGHATSGVKSYTGCLVSGDGVLIKIKEGSAPRSACTGGQVEAHFSGGDITKISVTGALTMPGGETSDENGEVVIGLKQEFTLPSGCSSGQVAKWNGSGWACAADNDTTYAAGTGLIETPAGPQDTDDAFSIHPDYRVKNTPDCSSGQFATGFDSSGNIQCAAPAVGLQTFQARQVNFVDGDGVPDDGADHTYVTLAVPAGTYLLNGKGVLSQGDDDVGFRPADAFGCRIGNLPAEQTAFFGKDNDPDEYGFALTGIVTTSGEPLTLRCFAESDLDLVSVKYGTLAAVKLG